MDHDIIIASIIGLIVIGQFWIFFTTLKEINLFKNVFPFSNKFKTIKVYIREDLIIKISNEEIFKNYSYYINKPASKDRRNFSIRVNEKEETYLISEYEEVFQKYENCDFEVLLRKNNTSSFVEKLEIDRSNRNGWSLFEKNIEFIEVTLVKSTVNTNIVLDKIIGSINTYLIKNKGAVSDFNLVKDIVERNCDSEDEQINTLLPIPLYLGLMGTMFGIIVGLFAMPPIHSETFEKAIPILIGGVKVAMIASLVGLGLTTIASGWFYKGAKGKIEGLKNDFYTFIQTELLPSISNSATNSIITLQTNLLKFNDGFTSNITRFDSLLTQILNSFNNQLSIVHELKGIDIAKLAHLNIDVLRELRSSTIEFEKFNQYIHQVNALVGNATELNNTLKSDLADIESRKYTVQQAFTKVNDSFENGLRILKESTDDRLRDVKDATKDQQDAFETYLKDNAETLKEIIDNEKSLLLEQLNQNKEVLAELKKQSELRQSLDKVEHAIAEQNKVLSSQTQTFSSLNRIVDELSKNVKKLSETNSSKAEEKLGISKPVKILAYAFMGTGVAIGISYIGYKLIVWSLALIKLI